MITVRGNFRRNTKIKVYEHWVNIDPCQGVFADIYEDAKGIYWYSTDGIQFDLADGWWFSYSYYDWGTDQYFYDGFNIVSGSKGGISYIGSFDSQCGPF